MNLLDITFSQAWDYCWTQNSYIVSFCILIPAAIAVLIKGLLMYRKTQQAVWGIVACAIFLVIVLATILSRPLSIKYNTSPEEQQRGVYVG